MKYLLYIFCDALNSVKRYHIQNHPNRCIRSTYVFTVFVVLMEFALKIIKCGSSVVFVTFCLIYFLCCDLTYITLKKKI